VRPSRPVAGRVIGNTLGCGMHLSKLVSSRMHRMCATSAVLPSTRSDSCALITIAIHRAHSRTGNMLTLG
jgi:hypothetical protein